MTAARQRARGLRPCRSQGRVVPPSEIAAGGGPGGARGAERGLTSHCGARPRGLCLVSFARLLRPLARAALSLPPLLDVLAVRAARWRPALRVRLQATGCSAGSSWVRAVSLTAGDPRDRVSSFGRASALAGRALPRVWWRFLGVAECVQKSAAGGCRRREPAASRPRTHLPLPAWGFWNFSCGPAGSAKLRR